MVQKNFVFILVEFYGYLNINLIEYWLEIMNLNFQNI